LFIDILLVWVFVYIAFTLRHFVWSHYFLWAFLFFDFYYLFAFCFSLPGGIRRFLCVLDCLGVSDYFLVFNNVLLLVVTIGEFPRVTNKPLDSKYFETKSHLCCFPKVDVFFITRVVAVVQQFISELVLSFITWFFFTICVFHGHIKTSKNIFLFYSNYVDNFQRVLGPTVVFNHRSK